MMSSSFGVRNPGGTVITNADRYVQMDVGFSTAVGSPTLFARVWGKRVIGNEASDTVTLSVKERRGLRIDWNPWTRPSDD